VVVEPGKDETRRLRAGVRIAKRQMDPGSEKCTRIGTLDLSKSGKNPRMIRFEPPPSWFMLSAAHHAQLLRALRSRDLRRAVSTVDPRGDPELVGQIVDQVGDALTRDGFDSDDKPTPEGVLLEDLIDYFVPCQPGYDA
jgi:hypothetical protein